MAIRLLHIKPIFVWKNDVEPLLFSALSFCGPELPPLSLLYFQGMPQGSFFWQFMLLQKLSHRTSSYWVCYKNSLFLGIAPLCGCFCGTTIMWFCGNYLKNVCPSGRQSWERIMILYSSRVHLLPFSMTRRNCLIPYTHCSGWISICFTVDITVGKLTPSIGNDTASVAFQHLLVLLFEALHDILSKRRLY